VQSPDIEGESTLDLSPALHTPDTLICAHSSHRGTLSPEFLEIDLPPLLRVAGFQFELPFGKDSRHVLKTFYCLFHRDAFLPQAWDPENRTFHEYALSAARRFEERVSHDLGERVFTVVFPDLANALVAADSDAPVPLSPEYLDGVREAALILLYRFLFLLYAEDRSLLPVRDKRYFAYSLRRIREAIRDNRDKQIAFSTTSSRLWDEFKSLCRAIATGDAAIGLPAYNGGLFEEERLQLLRRVSVPDADLAPVIDELSRRADETLPVWINYRDLSVQHLGGIYERLLQYRLEDAGGRLTATPTSNARRSSGSYYTHDDLVKLLIDEALGPLISERVVAFESLIAKWKDKERLPSADWEELDNTDPATHILDIRVCDPAMGSGHFLVSLVDYIADCVLENISHAVEIVRAAPWGKSDWIPPVALQIADLRARILKTGREQGWSIDASQLDDRRVVRRMILKRVVHGVDKNPMAVELAKVALWLHTFTVGAPLSFLDHHLRCGDALFGGWTHQLTDELGKLAGRLLQQEDVRRLRQARSAMHAIGELTDIDIAEAHRSKALMDEIERSLLPQKLALDFIHAKRWASAEELSEYEMTWADLLSGEFGDNILEAMELLSKPRLRMHEERQRRAHTVVQRALARASEIRFLHWDIAFPLIWSRNTAGKVEGGFDAIVGNPPWDRMKLQEVEWFAERRPEIARAVRASDRKKMIEKLKNSHDPLSVEYEFARNTAETAARVARQSGDYPLLSRGDINIYNLFVERAQDLSRPEGIVGLLVPSGIAADKNAATFFAEVAGSGRINALFDFENKKVFFPDVHASFKFCAFVFGGRQRVFSTTRCGFYLRDVSDVAAPQRILNLRAEDFQTVNPNTGAAPIFRSRRDADITLAIYRRQPILVDRREEGRTGRVTKVWPLRYVTMFHMTNDSNWFQTRRELEKSGWYPVELGRWKKGNQEMVPLYEGKMMQMYDHRAASVVVNAANIHRPASPEITTDLQHQDHGYFVTPQFWVAKDEAEKRGMRSWAVAFKDVTATTNARTMISAIVPMAGCGNTLPVLVPDLDDQSNYAKWGPLLLANISSLAFDFLARQKVQGQHLNWYIVEQLPMIRASQFEARIGRHLLSDFVVKQVLRLSFTAIDLKRFAIDLGYSGAPYTWDVHERRHAMARLDALFFFLYGLSREDADYIVDSFPILRENDEREFGSFVTKHLVLAYLNAIHAGDLDTTVRLQ
jgi:hypothetical protein